MYRYALLFCSFLAVPTAFGQTQTTDSQTLQALLAEVRQLRREMQANAATAQRMQILFFRLQRQEGVVTRMSQRVDEARASLAETQTSRKNMEAEAKRAQDSLERVQNAADRKNQEDMIHYLKRRSEALGEEEQQRQAKETEAEDQLRIEQGKLSDLQVRLEELEKLVQETHPLSTSNPQ
jgi:hypothetical protein